MRFDRRDFLKTAGALGALSLSTRGYSAQAGASPNGRINVGFIGLGGQGLFRLRGFMKHPDVNVTALCDVDQSHLRRAAELVTSTRGNSPALFGDFRKLIERKDVDAVCIATPDHWHALTTIYACNAGKDVFVEKPLCHTIVEGRAMVQAVARNKRITQLGNHMHNDYPNYRRAVEVVRSGMLGKIDRVYCWKSSANKGIGRRPDAPPPAELDYDLWLGPAPKRPYNPSRVHGSFRNFWDYSGGVFIDFWCHVSDVAWWALDLKSPKSVSATGARMLDDIGETPNTLDLLYEFPGGLTLSWNINPRSFPGFESHDKGCIFQGSEGTLAVDYLTNDLYVRGKHVPDFKRPPQSIPDSPGHVREFLDSIKSRQPTTCNIDYAFRLTKPGLLGNLAYRVGRRLYWDDEKEQIIGDAKARQLAVRRYRKPWKLV